MKNDQEPAVPPKPIEPMIEPAQESADLDIANRSLADALRISFSILRYAMLLLAIFFVFSGWFRVSEGEVVIRSRFGAISGEPGREILKPGGPYFAFPAPVDEVIRVPTTVQRVTLDNAFWFATNPQFAGRGLDEMPIPQGGLVPARDGFLLTGDQNIVHARWTVTYQVNEDDALEFISNVTDLDHAQALVQQAAEQGIVQVVSRSVADDFIRGQVDRSGIRRTMQGVLDSLNSGITVTEVLLRQPTPPLSVRPAFLEVGQAESERAQKIEGAERDRTRTHNEVAGAGFRPLSYALDLYESARRLEDGDLETKSAEWIRRLMDGEPAGAVLGEYIAGLPEDERPLNADELLTADRIGGRVSEIINQAKSYRTMIVAQLRSEADTFRQLLPMYEESPDLVRERLWRDTRERILSGDVEAFYLPDDPGKTLLLEFNRDPAVRRAREQQRLMQSNPQRSQP
ncbi:MAG TPA: hypothetical protein DEW46_01530 [Verrucomicrobia bacterium]|nr:hypothetical protein [Verrucomicrobiota bacterium]